MNRVYAARVSEDDHYVLIDMVHNYPSYSYERWLQSRAKELDQWRAEGIEVVEVDVTPDDFARYCRDTGARSDLNTFRGIAAAKGIGKFK
jgi:hypothetical protein